MPGSPLKPLPQALIGVSLIVGCIALQARPQSPLVAQKPVKTTLTSGVERLAGTEQSSQIQYARLILKGSIHSAAKSSMDPPVPDSPPILIAQCTLRPSGKYFFEMFVNFSGSTDPGFYPPWKPSGPQDLFPPRTDKVTITMDFLGYTHVKPFRRQWEIPVETPSLYRYNFPGSGSSNLEEFSFFLRYLRSLPTLSLTLDNRSAEFPTSQFLADIRSEPLCKAASF